MDQYSGAGRRPQVSVVIAFLNAEAFIEETLQSVVKQTLDDWELILVDDGSTDRSARLVKAIMTDHPDRMYYLTHENLVNKGVCASRNLAVRHASGQYIAFLDADDVWQPDKLAAQTAILHAHPDVGLVVGAPRYWSSWAGTTQAGSKDVIPRLGLEANSVHRKPALLLRCHPLGRASAPCPSDIMLRREVVDQVGGFEEAFTGNYQMYEDQAFLSKLYLATDVYVSDSTWTNYRLHAQSCCHRVTSSGAEAVVRKFYFDWLRSYLDEQGVHDERINRAFEKACRQRESMFGSQWLDKVRIALNQVLKRWS
ncbi:MAG: glycosyltransferase family 2 protein [Granulosicoccus sp.]|nr:glycosyltransferase family 2 protein [Granulosicoccus sp.]